MSQYLYSNTHSDQANKNLTSVFAGPAGSQRALIRVQIHGIGSQIGGIRLPRSILLVLAPSITTATLMASAANLLTTNVSLDHVMTVQKLLGRCRLYAQEAPSISFSDSQTPAWYVLPHYSSAPLPFSCSFGSFRSH